MSELISIQTAMPPPADWGAGAIETAAGRVPVVPTELSRADRLGTWRARWGVGRMQYTVVPGLYAVGSPTADSPVLVSANYKLSFDRLRSQLGGRDLWILVLDTRGINVWCAAGKGTFGTAEIVHRVATTRLAEVVSHRRLIVPQLGAPGVGAHLVKQGCGFRVKFGPVRAEDLPAWLDDRMKATPEMRRVRFPMKDRLALVPLELVISFRIVAMIGVGLLLLSGLGRDGYDLSRLLTIGLPSIGLLASATLFGVVLVPMLLPWLPGRAFAIKGAATGVVLLGGLGWFWWQQPEFFVSRLQAAAWLCVIPAVTSYAGMNFTGSSTYTSLSGVLREMRFAVPVQIGLGVVGLGLWVTGLFV